MKHLPENYFEKTKQVIIQKLKNCTEETITEEKAQLELLLTTLEGIALVEQQTCATFNTVIDTTADVEIKASDEPQTDAPQETEPEHKPELQRLNRRLRNGYLEPSKIFVPEKIIRENDWENGDYIEASRHQNDTAGFYDYKLIRKCPEKNNRIEANMLVVYKSNLTESPLEIHIRDEHLEIDLPVPLSKIDIERFDIKEGDIIDYAYWQNHMTKGAVVLRHSIPQQSLSQMLEEKAEKEKVKTVKKTSEENKSVAKTYYKQSFAGKTIVMVGGRDNVAQINKDAIENRGGTFIHIQGEKENKEKIENTVKKADLIVVYTNFIGHMPMWSTKEAAKLYQKPISFTNANGVNSFLTRCKSELGIYS